MRTRKLLENARIPGAIAAMLGQPRRGAQSFAMNIAWFRRVYPWYVVAVLMGVYMIGFADRQILSLLVGPVKASLGLIDTQFGLLQGFAFVMLFALLGVPIAAIADRHGRRRVLVAGLILWCIFTAACGTATGFWSLFACRVVVGLGESTISPCSLALICNYFPPHRRAFATSMFVSSGSIGVGLAFTVGGKLVDSVADLPAARLLGELATDSWRVAFMLVGLAGLLVLPLLLTIGERRGTAATQPATNNRPLFRDGQLRAFLHSHGSLVAKHFGAFAAFASISYGVLAWAPAYFIRRFHWSPTRFGLIFGLVFAIPSVSGTILGGWWASKLRAAGRLDANFMLMTWGLAGVGIPAALAPIVPSPNVAMVLYGVVAFFLSFPTGVSAAAVQDYAPEAIRARVSALYYVAVGLGGAGFGPLFVGLLTDYIFRADALVGRSLAVSGALFGALAFIFVSAAARDFRRRLAAGDAAISS